MLTLPQMLLSLVLVWSGSQVNYSEAIEISSYARVSRNGGDSITRQSDEGNESRVSDIDSTLIDKKNETATLMTERPVVQHRVEPSDEKSTGRAMQSNNYFSPLTQLLTRPVPSANNNNQKTGRFIVYPSYTGFNANNIDANSRTRYNVMPPRGYNQQTAQRRFQYTPDSILNKAKPDASSQGYEYAQPPAPQPPPVKFTAPIVVADTPKPTYLPPDMPPRPTYLPPGSDHFLPTMPPEDTTNPVIDLLNFPPHVDSSFMPPELEAIKGSIDSNHHSITEKPSDDSSEQATNAPPTDLSKFPPNEVSYLPPNAASAYLPPQPFAKSKTPLTSYLPPPSGNSPSTPEEQPYVPPKDLLNFPPNIDSMYLPPELMATMMKAKIPISSYLPPASGDAEGGTDSPDEPPSNHQPYIAPPDLQNFPPNIDSAYLPPEVMAMMMRAKIPINSYLPPASGDAEGGTDSSDVLPPNHQPYVAPPDLHNFPPNIDSAYLPPDMAVPEVPDNSYLPPASGNQGDNPNHYAYMPPADSSSFSDGSGPAPPAPQKLPAYMYNPPVKPQPSYPPPAPYMYNPPKPMIKQPKAPGYSYQPPSSGSVSGFQDGSKHNLPGPVMPPAMMTAPSGMDMGDPKDLGMSPPMDHDHHHHHHDYPDIIYDFDHDHHHHHHEEPTTTTTEAPEEPRVKKYSYYYLGRKLWYVPLYFTLWFCLYVAALIIRSIGRHKVDLPNHYVARSLHDMSHEELNEKINRMTAVTMQQIEEFKEKYL